MILAIVVLLALAAGGVVALWVARDPGYLLVAYDGATLETSVWFALLCAGALGAALLLVAFVVRRLLRVGAVVASRTGQRRTTRAVPQAAEAPRREAVEQERLAAWRADLGASSSVAQARHAWRTLPRAMRGSESLLLDFVDALVRHGAEDEAETVLRRALKKRWRAGWVLRYGSIGGDVAKRRAKAGEWLPKHEQDAALQLTLGRLARADGDLNAARKHLRSSIDLEAAPAALVEMGRLCASEGQHAAAVEYLERALEGRV